MNKERILKLADHIEQCDHVTDFSTFGDSTEREEQTDQFFAMRVWTFGACQSPACVAGHAVYMFLSSRKNRFDIFRSLCNSRMRAFSVDEAALKLLDLTSAQARELFMPSVHEVYSRKFDVDQYLSDTRLSYNDLLSPQVAAQTLRKFAKTGEVDWCLDLDLELELKDADTQ